MDEQTLACVWTLDPLPHPGTRPRRPCARRLLTSPTGCVRACAALQMGKASTSLPPITVPKAAVATGAELEAGLPGALPSPGSPAKRAPKKIDVVGAQTDGRALAADLPAAIPVPPEAEGWVPVFGDSNVRSLHSQVGPCSALLCPEHTSQRPWSVRTIGCRVVPPSVYRRRADSAAPPGMSQVPPPLSTSQLCPVGRVHAGCNVLPSSILINSSVQSWTAIAIGACRTGRTASGGCRPSSGS